MRGLMVALVMGAISGGAQAALVQVDFTGQVHYISGDIPMDPPAASVTGHAVYDDASTWTGSWSPGVVSFDLDWGGWSLSRNSGIQTVFDYALSAGDQFRFSGGSEGSGFDVIIRGDALLFPALANRLPKADEWQLEYLRARRGEPGAAWGTVEEPGWSMGYQITDIAVSPVPAPAAVWLFGSALCLLAWTRRRIV